MPKFTIEITYHLPVFRHQTIEADNLEEALRLAIEDQDWSRDQKDYECVGETYVSGAWHGARAAYYGRAIPIPSQFHETVQRKADHFDELLKRLEQAAQPMGISPADFKHWLPTVQAAVRKAKAILENQRDPGDIPV